MQFSLLTIQFIFAKNKIVNKQLDYNSTAINYNIVGSGSTVVLLHGFLEELSIWNDLSQKLSSANQVIAIDLPGFGNSGLISETHSMNLMADAVNEILRTECILKCIIVGHSMGGYVALAFAELFPKKISGLVLFHSQAAGDDCKAKKNRDRTIEIVKNNHSKFIISFIPELFCEMNVGKYKSEIEHLTKVSLRTKDEGIIASLRGMRDRKDQIELLKELKIPVLFIAGKQDSKIPLEKINLQFTFPKISEALILDNVGHMGFIEAKDITFAAIVSFVNRYQNYE